MSLGRCLCISFTICTHFSLCLFLAVSLLPCSLSFLLPLCAGSTTSPWSRSCPCVLHVSLQTLKPYQQPGPPSSRLIPAPYNLATNSPHAFHTIEDFNYLSSFFVFPRCRLVHSTTMSVLHSVTPPLPLYLFIPSADLLTVPSRLDKCGRHVSWPPSTPSTMFQIKSRWPTPRSWTRFPTWKSKSTTRLAWSHRRTTSEETSRPNCLPRYLRLL